MSNSPSDSATPQAELDEPTVPFPPRFRWLKRLGWAMAAAVVVVVAVRLVWGWRAERTRAAARVEVAALGWPASVDDLNRPATLDPESNAATFLNRAVGALGSVASPAGSNLEYAPYPPFPPQWHRLADAAYAANRPALDHARAARRHARAEWAVAYATPLANTSWANLSPHRELANQLGDAALRVHLRGNDAAAIEFVRDGLHQARTIDGIPMLGPHLVAMGMEMLALERLMTIAPGLAPPADGDDVPPGAAAPGGSATRGQLRALVTELLFEPAPSLRTAAAMRTGALIETDALRWRSGTNPLLNPVLDLEEAKIIRGAQRLAVAAAQPDLASMSKAAGKPLARDPYGTGALDGSRRRRILDMLAHHSDSGYVLTLDIRVLAERRMAAVSLAAQWFRADERRWPRTLDELVPKYLPAVPRDPFRTDGGPLSYLVATSPAGDGAERPVVYDVGDGARDNTPADGSSLQPYPAYSWQHFGWNEEYDDQWRDLSRFVPPAPPVDTPPPDDWIDLDGDGIPDGPRPADWPPPPPDAPQDAVPPEEI